MPRSLPQTGATRRRFTWPTGTPQIIALLLVLLIDSLVAPHFFQIIVQDGRLFGSPIDILNRAAPVALPVSAARSDSRRRLAQQASRC